MFSLLHPKLSTKNVVVWCLNVLLSQLAQRLVSLNFVVWNTGIAYVWRTSHQQFSTYSWYISAKVLYRTNFPFC